MWQVTWRGLGSLWEISQHLELAENRRAVLPDMSPIPGHGVQAATAESSAQGKQQERSQCHPFQFQDSLWVHREQALLLLRPESESQSCSC